LLSADAGTFDFVPLDLTMEEIRAAEIERAFQRVSDLDQYTTEQMAAVTQWVVHVAEGTDAAVLAEQLGAPLPGTDLIDDTYFYTVPDGSQTEDTVALFQSVDTVEYFYPLVPLDREPRFVPNDPYLDDQWHLINTGQSGGTAGEDANVEPAWDKVSGNGVVIGIVDDGLEHTHPDLSPYYRADLSYDFVDDDADPSPGLWDSHGTSAGGVAAAAGNNDLGVAGAAYEAELAGLRLLGANQDDDTESAALGHEIDEIDVYNNSWGPPDGYAWMEAPGPLTLAAIQDGANIGRGGLGNIYMWAGGNGLESQDDVNYDGYANNRYTIAVGAVDHNGVQSFYSENGAPLLVVAHSNNAYAGDPGHAGIVTTDVTGEDGYNSTGTADDDAFPDTDYTETFGGTSSATPLAAGVVGLMLEANPNLSYRDVEHILVESARKNDASDSDWSVNGAGHDINHKYGFGVVDAEAAVNLAETWTEVQPEIGLVGGPFDVIDGDLPDNTGTALQVTLPVTDDIPIEWVEVTFNISHTLRADLHIELESPDGTISVLAEEHTPSLFELIFGLGDGASNYSDWTFTTARHWGERTAGDWLLRVEDQSSDQTGTWNSFSIGFFGWDDAAPVEVGYIEGTKFSDINGNGAPDSGEPGLGGFVIFADANGNGTLDRGEVSTTTASDGSYQLQVDPGTYDIYEVQQSGWTQTAPPSGVYTDVAVADQETVSGADFGNDPDPFTVRGFKWDDANQNRSPDAGEQPVAGIEVYIDLNNNNQLDSGEPSAITQHDGTYEITADTGPGSYTIREVEQPAFVMTYPTSGEHAVTVSPGDTVSNLDFGNYYLRGSIAGRKWNDINGDGVDDLGEPGMANVVIYVDLNDDGERQSNEPFAASGPDGSYLITEVPQGSYTLAEVLPVGMLQTFPSGDGTHPVTVLPNEVTDGLDFGNKEQIDFGDAPAPYPTLRAQGGAYHNWLPDYHLGTSWDADNDGLPEEFALGDDQDDRDDEDGVRFVSGLIAGHTAEIEVFFTQRERVNERPPQGGLNAWVDFNLDGDWDDEGEQIFEFKKLVPGTNTLTFEVPVDAEIGRTYARFRLAVNRGVKPTGPAIFGEVEDYQVRINAHETGLGIFGRDEYGNWLLARALPNGLGNEVVGVWQPRTGWTNVMEGDFTGNGITDIVGRDWGGRWWVSESTDGGLVTQYYSDLQFAPGMHDLLVADVNADEFDDLIAWTDDGKWWAGVNTGSTFQKVEMGAWDPGAGWRDVQTADFDRNGTDDVFGLDAAGNLWVLSSDGANLTNHMVGFWDPADEFDHVNVADISNDGYPDVLGLNKRGEWWLAQNEGAAFPNYLWGIWSDRIDWKDVQLGDFDGDMDTDVAGRSTLGEWWLARNMGSIFANSFYGRWSTDTEWHDVTAADFNHDGRDDLIGRDDNETWWLSTNSGTRFENEVWGEWASDRAWLDVLVGSFY
jgi:subtilisin-like proprotein convertase family protein